MSCERRTFPLRATPCIVASDGVGSRLRSVLASKFFGFVNVSRDSEMLCGTWDSSVCHCSVLPPL